MHCNDKGTKDYFNLNFFLLLHDSKAKLVERIKSGEDLMKISEPTFASMVWRNTILTYLFLMHQNPYGGRECSLMQLLQTVS